MSAVVGEVDDESSSKFLFVLVQLETKILYNICECLGNLLNYKPHKLIGKLGEQFPVI